MTAETLAFSVVHELRRAGHQAYWVGGCVRDRLLGQEAKDIDVATDATPAEARMLFPDSEMVGAAFGVLLVKSGGTAIEVATFRVDHEYKDGRRPEGVTFTRSAEQDVQRRDFTINGLLYDPIERRVLDYVGGQADLEAKIVRAIGDPEKRFEEDRLRMLRAVRFAARLGFEIEPETLEAIRRQAPGIEKIAAERIRGELNRILTEGAARRGFELLDHTRLLAHILPEVKNLQGVEQPPQYHPEGDVWTHTMIMLEGLPAGCTPTLAMGVLLHDIGKPGTFERAPDRIRFNGHVELGVEIAERICRRLRYSNAETEQILALVENHMRFAHVKEMRQSKLKRFVRMDGFDEHMALHRLDCLSADRSLGNYEFVKRERKEFERAAAAAPPEPLLTGRDLIELGYEPGPEFKPILEAVEDARLEDRISSREEALELVAREFPVQRPNE